MSLRQHAQLSPLPLTVPAALAPTQATAATGWVPPNLQEAYPGYLLTTKIDAIRAEHYSHLDRTDHAYLDYTGACLVADTQLRAHFARLDGICLGNPHSESPASRPATELVEQARAAVLRFLRASPEEYTAIFTPNATGACRLVGEAYPFDKGTTFALTCDNHNSVNGIREYARVRGAAIDYISLTSPELRVDEETVQATLRRHHGGGLFAYPAQSNFSGVRHPLEWIELAHGYGYDVLLDAAAYLPTNALDLSVVHPDFVTVSWYKVFGYPTGVGCLVARREALARLQRPWFSGGTVHAASVAGGWHAPADGEAGFEDGTVNFLNIPDVECGISWIDQIGIDLIHRRVGYLTGWMLDWLGGLRHSNGSPLVRLYGPATTERRGGTVTFNVLDPAGRVVDERIAARDLAAANISVRTGCFCNPGAAERAFAIDSGALRLLGGGEGQTIAPVHSVDQYADLLGLPSTGAIRASLGLVSNAVDVERLCRCLEQT